MDERDERRNAEWKTECVKLLCSSLQNEDPNIFDIETHLGELGIHESVRDERVRLVAAVAIVNIYKLATKAGAGVADFSFVLDHPQHAALEHGAPHVDVIALSGEWGRENILCHACCLQDRHHVLR